MVRWMTDLSTAKRQKKFNENLAWHLKQVSWINLYGSKWKRQFSNNFRKFSTRTVHKCKEKEKKRRSWELKKLTEKKKKRTSPVLYRQKCIGLHSHWEKKGYINVFRNEMVIMIKPAGRIEMWKILLENGHTFLVCGHSPCWSERDRRTHSNWWSANVLHLPWCRSFGVCGRKYEQY